MLSKAVISMTQRIGVFGSAFNPPHRGHLDVVNQAVQAFEAVIVVPSFKHAFGKEMLAFEVRMSLTEALFGEKEQSISVSAVEREIANTNIPDRPVYTYDVLQELQERNPAAEINFIVGPDNAHPDTWKRFYRSEDILAQWGIWVAEETVPVRSTLIREMIRNGERVPDTLCPISVMTEMESMGIGFAERANEIN